MDPILRLPKNWKQIFPDDASLFMASAAVMAQRAAWMQIITQNPLPAGEFATPLTGDKIGASAAYVELFRNKAAGNPVGVEVYGYFALAGRQIKLSLSNTPGDEDVWDWLGDTGGPPSFGHRKSTTCVVPPGKAIWIANAVDPTVFPLTVDDVFRVRYLDVAEYMADNLWQPKA